ncbi:MAG: ABC transporter permease subunit [Chloroflexi bacterium]|nr:ABC transporter permease subunit [Chloroflexota bacterium]
MGTILKRSLARSRGQIIGWGLSLGLLAAYLCALFDTMAAQATQYRQIIAAIPAQFMAFFGPKADMFSAVGYLNMGFFSYMPIVAGIYAILAGSGLLASDEEAGTLDLLLAHPLRRGALLIGRVLGFVIALGGILALAWVGFAVTAPNTQLGVTAWQIALPMVCVWALLFFYGMLALFLAMILPSRSAAASTVGLGIVVDYFVNSWKAINPRLEPLARFLPLHYFQEAGALDGLDLGMLSVLVGAGLVLMLYAWWRFEERDIRVAGEGGWRLPGLGRRATPR